MTINLHLPQKSNIKPSISVFGVGGAGCNAVSNMIASNLEDINFVVGNTDAQGLEQSLAERRIQLGETITQGLGAGSYPEVGRAAAEEAIEDIGDAIQGCNMLFVTAGLGGGTGTGASPVIARIAREQGILTVGVVTKPFHFEGTHRMRVAELGLQELEKYVDTLIVIPNQNLFRIADKNTTFLDAFKMADQVLHDGVRGITDLMVMPGLINLDFADIRSVMGEMGKAMMGTGEASGDNRAIQSAEAAISNPLLDNVSMKGARGVLINITGGPDMTLFEVDEAANRIREEVDAEANIIFGSTYDETAEGSMRVSVVATGIDAQEAQEPVQRESRANPSPIPEVSAPTQTESKEVEEIKVSLAEKLSKPQEPEPEIEEEHEEEQTSLLEEEEDDNAFIPPEPEEPEMANFPFGVEDVDEEPVAEQEKRELFIPTRSQQRGSKLFGGLFGKKEGAEAPASNTTAEPKTSPSVEVKPKAVAEKEDAYAGEDPLEIPAFLRRKSG